MRAPSKWIIWLLAVHLLVAGGWIMFCVVAPDGPPSDWFMIAIVSAGLGQGSLLGIWAALGGKPWPWRLLAATVVLVISSRLLEWLSSNFEGAIYTFFLLAELLGTVVPLLALRLLGLRLTALTARDGPEEGRSLQFSLRGLLEWTTALAVLLSTVPLMPEEFRDSFRSLSNLLEMLTLFGLDGLLALVCLWMALGKQRTTVRLLTLGVVGLLVAVVVEKSMPDPGQGWMFGMFGLYTLWTAGTLWVFRAAGYRIAWRWRIAPTESLGGTTGCENASKPEVTAE